MDRAIATNMTEMNFVNDNTISETILTNINTVSNLNLEISQNNILPLQKINDGSTGGPPNKS